jgi:hypothetical protein
LSKSYTIWALEALISELPKDKRTQAAGALRTLRQLLGVKDD